MKSARDSLRFVVRSLQLKKFLAAFFIFHLSFSILPAQNYPAKPNPPRLVNDFAGMLSSSENQMLENKLVKYDDSTSTQISIVIVNSFEGAEKAQYATETCSEMGNRQR